MVGILETTVDLKSSPEKFIDMFVDNKYQVPSLSPSHVQACELGRGAMGEVGSVTVWRYVHDGETKVLKEKMESIDLENNQVTFKVLEGDLMKEYKSFLITLQVNAKEGDLGSVAHWQFHYEKINEEVAHPDTLLLFAVMVSKEIDAHLLF